jgi:hypothetical protein
MTQLTFEISLQLTCEDWFDKEVRPKTKEQWAEFFSQFLMPEMQVIGVEEEIEPSDEEGVISYSKMIAIDSWQIKVKKITSNEK